MKIKIIMLFILVMLISGCGGTTTTVVPSEKVAPVETVTDPVPVETVAPVESDLEVPDPVVPVDPVVPSPVDDTPSVKEISMSALKWEFLPPTITVKQGETVKLSVESQDVAHGIMIPELGVNLRLSPGSVSTAEFVAENKGEFPFFCSVPCGSGHSGMKGTVIVE